MKRLQNILKELFVFVSADSEAAPILLRGWNDFWFFVVPGEYHNVSLVRRLLAAGASRGVTRFSDEFDMN